jgi:hypothetical protein
MTSSLDRRLENVYVVSKIEVTEAGLDITLNSTWINDLSSNKKIGNRRITAEIDPEAGYPFTLDMFYSTKQGSSYYIHYISININIARQRMSDIGQNIVDQIDSSEYVANDINLSFDYMNEDGYLYISAAILVDTSFTFYLRNE